MRIYNLQTIGFNNEEIIMHDFNLIDGDRISLNHLPQDAIRLYYESEINNDLSFVKYNIRTLEDYSFILLKEENIDNRERGVKIIAIGYNCNEAYRDLLEQLKFHVSTFMDGNRHKYDYIWGQNIRLEETMAAYSEGDISCIDI